MQPVGQEGLSRAEEVLFRVFPLLIVEALDVVEYVGTCIFAGTVDPAADPLGFSWMGFAAAGLTGALAASQRTTT